jgi:arabinan endo-1,5-alpha-L-arabinosidase
MYVNGKSIPFARCNGSLNGTDFTLAQKFDYNLIVDHVTKCQYFNLGYGSFWGSADAHFDDLMIHNRVLRLSEVITLRTLESRDWNLGDVVTGIDAISYDSPATTADKAVYSINGIKVANSINDETFKSLPSGIYVSGNKKILK